jgi:hypothetical protein
VLQQLLPLDTGTDPEALRAQTLQVRCAVLNGKLGSGFEPLFDAEVNPIADLARAA